MMQTVDWGTTRAGAAALLRALPVAIVGGLIGGALANAALGYQRGGPTASVEIGVTRGVEWPFFDVAVGQAQAVAAEQGSIVVAALGDDFVDYRVERVEGSLLFDIVVEAKTAEAAESGTAVAFEATIEALVGLRASEISTEIAILSERLDAAVVAADGEATAYIDALVAEDGAITEQQQAEAQSKSEGLRASRTEADRAVVNLATEVARAELSLALLQPEVQAVTWTSAEDNSQDSTRLAVAVGFGAALLLAMALLVAIRTNGLVRSAKHAEEELGVRCVSGDDVGATSTQLRRVVRLASNDGHRCLLIDPIGNSSAADLPAWLADADSVGVPHDGGIPMQFVVDPSVQNDALGTCTAVVVLGTRHKTTIRSLRQQIARHQAGGLDVVGVVLS